MKNLPGILAASAIILTIFTIMPAYAADIDTSEDDIIRIEEDGEESSVATFTVADDVTLPVVMTIESGDTGLRLNIDHNGRSFMIAPGRYKVTKVIDGRGKKLTSGATLTILDKDADYYLDFKKPDDGFHIKINWKEVLIINIVFAVIAFIAVKLFRKYRDRFIG